MKMRMQGIVLKIKKRYVGKELFHSKKMYNGKFSNIVFSNVEVT